MKWKDFVKIARTEVPDQPTNSMGHAMPLGDQERMAERANASFRQKERHNREMDEEWERQKAFWEDVERMGMGAAVDKWHGGLKPVYPELYLIGGRAALNAVGPKVPGALRFTKNLYTGRYAQRLGNAVGEMLVGPRTGKFLGSAFRRAHNLIPLAATATGVAANMAPNDFLPEPAKKTIPWLSKLYPSWTTAISYPVSRYLSANPDVLLSGLIGLGGGMYNWGKKVREGRDVKLAPSVGGHQLSFAGAISDGMRDGLPEAKENIKKQLEEIARYSTGQLDFDDLSEKGKAYVSINRAMFDDIRRGVAKAERYAPVVSRIGGEVSTIGSAYGDAKDFVNATNMPQRVLAAHSVAGKTIPAGTLLVDDAKTLKGMLEEDLGRKGKTER